MTPTYSVIVVSHGLLPCTARCIESLRRHCPAAETELLFVDCGSTDGTRSYLTEIAGKIGATAKTVFLEGNEGWCGGANAGLERATGTYLVLLNNDVIVTPDWLVGLRECMDQATERLPGLRRAGLVGPVTGSAGGPQQVANPPLLGRLLSDTTELDAHARKHREALRHDWRASFFLSGFCLLLHRQCYRDVGGLDPLFSPGGFDDNDLVLRAQKRGWEAVIAGDVYVHHEGGDRRRDSEYRPDGVPPERYRLDRRAFVRSSAAAALGLAVNAPGHLGCGAGRRLPAGGDATIGGAGGAAPIPSGSRVAAGVEGGLVEGVSLELSGRALRLVHRLSAATVSELGVHPLEATLVVAIAALTQWPCVASAYQGGALRRPPSTHDSGLFIYESSFDAVALLRLSSGYSYFVHSSFLQHQSEVRLLTVSSA